MTGRAGLTVTSNPAEALLPATSNAVTISWVVPIGKVPPLAMGLTTTDVTPLSASNGVEMVNVTTAPAPDVAVVVMAFGRAPLTSGGVLSIRTVRGCGVSTLPVLSVEEYRNVVVPSAVIVTLPLLPANVAPGVQVVPPSSDVS